MDKKELLKRIKEVEDGKVYTTQQLKEILFQEKTLSEKIITDEYFPDIDKVYLRDVKEHLKKFIDSFTKYEIGHLNKDIMKAKAKESFGDRVVS
ncbi:hypothetical protein LCGC14_0374040 [marine sediment metagenome]|uniref:Uncharacterized protein n=1 Tax=marine sediment metagenome TaxID=412755 RepID=A0A0F9T9Y4_9ZZZZ